MFENQDRVIITVYNILTSEIHWNYLLCILTETPNYHITRKGNLHIIERGSVVYLYTKVEILFMYFLYRESLETFGSSPYQQRIVHGLEELLIRCTIYWNQKIVSYQRHKWNTLPFNSGYCIQEWYWTCQ